MNLDDGNVDGYADPMESLISQYASSGQSVFELATSPDDVQTQLNSLPSYGGIIKLDPDIYGDSDWTQTITIPTNSNSHYIIDMRGSEIDIDTFSGPYIERTASAGIDTQPITLLGPSKFDVSDVTNPGDVMNLWDISESHIHWPVCNGSVDSIIRLNAQEGSCHHNNVLVSGFGMDKGIVIGDQTGSISCDRSHWRGQLGGIGDIGVHVVNGQTHHFWVQPEDGATGYKIEKAANYIHNAHGVPTTPMDITADTNITAPRYQGWNDSLILSRLSGWNSDRVRVQTDDFYLDPTISSSGYDTNGGNNLSNGDFGNLNFQTGTTGNAEAYLRTPNRAGGQTSMYMNAKLSADEGTDESTVRVGFWNNDNNWIGMESANDGNWRGVAVVGGSRVVDTEPSTSVIRDGSVYEIAANINASGDARVGVADVDTGGWDFVYKHVDIIGESLPSPMVPNVWLINDGTVSTSQGMDLFKWEYGAAQ